MHRRNFLRVSGAGVAGSLGLATVFPDDISVRWWATPQAASYPNVRERIEGYLDKGLKGFGLPVSVSYGGVVPVPTESAYDLVVDGVWPRRLFQGVMGDVIDPVNGVNLLVTDSSMRRAPTGAGVPYVAAVGGAERMSRAPPAEEVDRVVHDSPVLRTAQIVLHECGHALGLQHDHGSIDVRDGRAVVSPMVSGYAWITDPIERRQFAFTENRCGDPYPSVAGTDPYLLMRFDDCERRGLRHFHTAVLPSTPLPDGPWLSPDALEDFVSGCATCALEASSSR